MIRTLIQILLLLITLNLFGQTDNEKLKPTSFESTTQNQIYRIEFRQNQFLELIEFKNGEYSGHLVNFVTENKRKKSQNNLIVQKIRVPNLLAKKLMIGLKTRGIENILNCDETKNCLKGFDGTSTSIYISKPNESKSYTYWEVESSHYYKNGNVPEEIQKLRDILTFVENEIHYKNQFKQFLDRLPKGSYSFNGVNMIKT